MARDGKLLDADALADYLLEVGATLAAYGCPSYRVEDTVVAIARSEGERAEAFALPTGFFVTLRTARGAPLQRMTRVESRGVDLGRLTEVDRIFNDVAERRSGIDEARTRLRALELSRDPYSAPLRWLSMAVLAGAVAVFFRGGAREVFLAATASVCTAAVARALRGNPSGRLLVDFIGGIVAALVAAVASRFWPTVAREVVVLAGVIVLVPGMTLTTGLAELAQKNLVSGGARLAEALVTFVSIVLGVALVLAIEQRIGSVPPPPPSLSRVGLGAPMHVVALVLCSFALAVAFTVPRRYVPAALVSCGTAHVATTLAGRALPGHAAAFVAALALCVVANAFARRLDRPAQLFQVPGMMLLVPGSFGFASFESFLRGDIAAGAQQGFSVLLVAAALVMGVLVANVVLPARKLL